MSEIEDYLGRLNSLKSARTNFDTIWQDVKDLIWPDGGDFTKGGSPGERTTDKIYDMTATVSLEQGAAALETFLTPRTQTWHRLRASDEKLNESANVKEWLETANKTLFRFRNNPKARFYSQVHEGWKSTLAYGNNCIFVDEMPEGGTRYRYTHIGQTWIDTDDQGNVDTVYREFKLSAKAACQRWGDDAPKCAKDAMAKEPFTEHTYLHIVHPRDEYAPGLIDEQGMAFEAHEICVDDRKMLSSGGYHELPYMWSRYTVNPDEKYGRGPGMLILPDIQTLQSMMQVFMRSGHKVADPPLLVANDGVLGRGSKRIRLNPGGINVGGLDAQGRPLIMPLQTGARLDLTKEMMDQIKALIRTAFGVDVFEILVQDRTEMTATEVLERAKEKGQLLTPMIGRQQSELLGPMIARELSIAQRQGRLPPLPQELVEAKGEYEIEYESDATRMAKAGEVSALSRSIEATLPFLQANPSLLEVWKQDDTIRHIADALGVPTKLIRTPQEFKRVQQAMAQAQAQQAQMEQMPMAAKGVRDLAAANKDMAA